MSIPAELLSSPAAQALPKGIRKVLLAIIEGCSANSSATIGRERFAEHFHVAEAGLKIAFATLAGLGLVEITVDGPNKARRFKIGTAWAEHDLAAAQAIVIAARAALPKLPKPPTPEKSPYVRSARMEKKLAENMRAQQHHDPLVAAKITLWQIPWPTKHWDDL